MVRAMRPFIAAMSLSWLLGCAHEATAVAKALSCSDVSVVASAPERAFAQPRVVTGAQTAASTLLSGVSALMSATSSDDARGFVPAQGTQVSSPGWRHYVGCKKAMVCFDGGSCFKVDDASLQRTALKVPLLMQKSLEERKGQCLDAHADRRGPLVWSVSACGSYLGCAATRDEGYGCAAPDGR